MKLNLSFFHKIFVLGCLIVAVGCSKDDDFVVDPPSVEGELYTTDTLTIGEELLLNPAFSNSGISHIEWSVNDSVVSTDPTYLFAPETRGTHYISVSAENESGEITREYDIHTWGAFENGFYLINEGWLGHGTGTVSFYRYDTQQLEDSVYVKTNPTKNLNPTTSTLGFGTIYNEKLYLVSKVGGPMIVSDAYSLKEEQRIPSQPGNDWRAFVGVTETEGLLSSGDGIYRIDLQTLQVIGKIPGVTGQIGDMKKAGNHIFVLSQSEGAIVLNATSYEKEKQIPGMVLGFAETEDGSIWVAGGTELLKINPATLETEEIALGFQVYGSWGAWHPASISASDNHVFIAKNAFFSGGNEIYKYDGKHTSLEEPFISLPESEILYGAGLGYNPVTGQLLVNTVRKGFGENFSYNNLYFYDPETGGLRKSESFSGYYFPAVPVFHE